MKLKTDISQPVEDFQLKLKMLATLMELKSDERLTYSPATIFANAPLALIQCSMEAQIHLLENLLDLPRSKFPLKKK